MRGESSRVAARVRELLGDADAADGSDLDDLLPPARPLSSAWHRLVNRLPVRIDPGRRTALAVGVAVLIAAIVTGAWVAAAKPRSMAVSASVPSLSATPVGSVRPSPATAAGPTSSTPSAVDVVVDVVVDVAGKVHRPGLYHLGVGARIDDAVRAAGGALAGVDLSSLNLAARVVDGQQILVGGIAAAAPKVTGGAPTAAGTTGPVNLNTASLELLQTLPGVGPVLAQHILDFRTQHGSFSSVDQLNDVSGIGEVKFAGLRTLVAV